MSRDIIIPKGDLEPFVKRAKKLGISELIVVGVGDKTEIDGVKIKYAQLMNSQPKRKKGVMTLCVDPEKARFATEHPNVDALVGMEKGQPDFIHHRGSGLNHIIAKMLSKKGKEYFFDLRLLIDASAKEQAKMIGKMRQNLMLFKKFKVKHSLVSMAGTPSMMRSEKDRIAFLRMLQSKN